MANYIWVTNQKELFHCYPNAPMEVAFLRNRHRHIFHFKTWIEIKEHNDREIEFIMFKNFIQDFLDRYKNELNNKSCEMISDDIYNYIKETYPNRKVIIEVSEDLENGSYKEYFNNINFNNEHTKIKDNKEKPLMQKVKDFFIEEIIIEK